MNRSIRGALLAVIATTGCAGNVEVTRTFSPVVASRMSGDKLEPTAVVRGGQRIALPSNARVEADRVVLPSERVHVLTLQTGDVIQQDAQGRIVAVRSSGNPPVYTRFVAGTAFSAAGSDEVRGQLDGTPTIPLLPTDGIEMRGFVAPHERIPGGGRVESSRSTAALISGAIVLALSYAPTAYVGATSSRSSDRSLEIPVAGPWINLAQRSSCVAPVTPIPLPVDPCIVETANRAAVIASGAVQGIGTLLTIIGLPSYSRIVDGGDRGVAVIPTLGGATAIARF